MFASDYPVLSFERCLGEAANLDLPDEVRQRWLYDNADAFFFGWRRVTVALEAGLVGRDEQVLCSFYTGAMGFTLVDRREFEVGTVYKLRRDAARLKLFFPRGAVDPVTSVEPWFRPGGWRYAALNLPGLDEVDRLVRRGRRRARTRPDRADEPPRTGPVPP